MDIFFEQIKVLVGSGQGRKPKRTMSALQSVQSRYKTKSQKKKKKRVN